VVSTRWRLVGSIALVVLTAGCTIGDASGDGPAPATDRVEEAAEPAGEEAPVHTLTLRAWTDAELADLLAVEDLEADPIPQPIDGFQLGPAERDAEPVVLARFNVTEGHRLESFRLHLTVNDGIGPAQIGLEVPAWTAREDARVDVHLELPEVGEAGVDHVDGDLAARVLETEAQPRYGYLVWPSGNRQTLDGLDRVVHVPAEFPRFGSEAEPSFRADRSLRWSLDGTQVAAGERVDLDPEPGRHTLTIEDPATGGEAEIAFSLHQRFARQGQLLVGTLDHRESVTGANEDTYNVSIAEGVRSLNARLEPVGNHSDVENLDLYALNETGGVVEQSTTNGTEEVLGLSRTDLADLEEIRLRVHGEKAAHTEYRLSGTVFYWPW
jgi:hypothetical protein